MWQEYYEAQLYPLQDKVLALMEKASSKFYLTGGTALSRAYLHHRYSDDLDFFVNHEPDFKKHTQLIINLLKENFKHIEIALTYEAFARCFVVEEQVSLKIEFINDVPYRVGQPQKTHIFTRTDTIANILSNKICALSRCAAKDLADIWQIALSYPFNWKNIVEDAKQKDAWVDESQVMIAIEQFNIDHLAEVKWAKWFAPAQAKQDFKTMLGDILLGNDNSLCQTPPPLALPL